jgi:hypothetical protein
MKKILTLSAMLLVMAIIFTGCSKEKTLQKRLVGTWNIDILSGTVTPSGGGAGTSYSYSNIGTFTFKDDGTGSSVITVSGQTENSNFNWVNTATTVTITESGHSPSIYTVSTNEKTKQVWTYSDNDASTNTTDNGTVTFSKK